MHRSREELRNALGRLQSGAALPLEPHEIVHVFDFGHLSTLLCDDPEAKILAVSQLVSSVLGDNNTVAYIDLDTLFTVFLDREGQRFQHLENLIICNPDDTNIDEAVASFCSTTSHSLKLVVFDSVTTFYHIFRGRVNFGRLNQKLSVYVAFFRRAAKSLNAMVLLTTMAKARRVSKPGGAVWVPAYAGGRALERASDSIIKLHRADLHAEMTLLKHRDSGIQGRVLRFPLTA